MRLGADHEASEHPEARDVFVTGHLLFPSILYQLCPLSSYCTLTNQRGKLSWHIYVNVYQQFIAFDV